MKLVEKQKIPEAASLMLDEAPTQVKDEFKMQTIIKRIVIGN